MFLQLDVAEECLRHAKDLSGLLLLYSAVGDAEGLESLLRQLGRMAKTMLLSYRYSCVERWKSVLNCL